MERRNVPESRQAIYKVDYAVPVTINAEASTGFELIGNRKIIKEGTVVDSQEPLLKENQTKVTAKTVSAKGVGILLSDLLLKIISVYRYSNLY